MNSPYIFHDSCRLHDKYPETPKLPVSAKAECDLQALQKSGNIQYQCGAASFCSAKGHSNDVTSIQKTVLER